jgi:hypothetical protein
MKSVRTLSLFAAALILLGCSTILGIESGHVESGPCASDDDCEPGHACLVTQCRASCDSESDCPAASTCLITSRSRSCVTAGDLSCTDNSACPAGTSCVSGVCRAPCGIGCLDGQDCVDNSCVDLGESDAGN